MTFKILVGLCRDASILVRTSAITGLSELLMQKPSDAVVDAFLTGPMNQLSDPEAKVGLNKFTYSVTGNTFAESVERERFCRVFRC